jgi:hypothetical protein
MEQDRGSISDEDIWNKALQRRFLSPPSQWIFHDDKISFGNNPYNVTGATFYELALLDIHSQYWEVTGPGHLRRYHRSLQYMVEEYFQSHKAKEVHRTPLFVRPWLNRIMFKTPHHPDGRKSILKILDEIPAEQRSKLDTGNLQSEGMILNLHTS